MRFLGYFGSKNHTNEINRLKKVLKNRSNEIRSNEIRIRRGSSVLIFFSKVVAHIYRKSGVGFLYMCVTTPEQLQYWFMFQYFFIIFLIFLKIAAECLV